MIAAHALLRVAGMPTRTLDAFRCPRTRAALDEIEALEREDEAAREPLCDALYARIPALDAATRRAVLDVKRRVHNGREPGERDVAALATDAGCTPEVVAALSAWAARRRRIATLERELDAAFETDRADVRVRLGETWRDDAFGTGLLMSEPKLFERLGAYLDATAQGRALGKRLRQFEGTGIAYCYRMATKTSPFSAFTATSLCRLDGDEPGLRVPEDAQWGDTFMVKTAVSEALVRTLLRDPARRRECAVALNPTVVPESDGDALLFLGRVERPPSLDVSAVEERFSTLRATPPVRRLLALLEERAAPVDQVELVATLAEALGVPEETERVAGFVDSLLDAGLLVSELGYPARAHELCVRGLNGHGASLAQGLDAVSEIVGRLPALPSGERAASLPAAHDAMGEVLRHARLTPRAVVQHERHHGAGIHMAPQTLGGAGDDLARLARVLPMFDDAFLLKRMVAAHAREQCGPDGEVVPLTRFLRAFYVEAFEPYFGGGSNRVSRWDPFLDDETARGLPRVAEMARGREAFVDAVVDLVGAGATPSVALPEALLASTADHARAFAPSRVAASVGFFTQGVGPVDADGRLRGLVVNQTVAGYGTYLARYTAGGLADADARALAASLRETYAALPREGELVELLGTFGFVGQVHAPVTERCLLYPGEQLAVEGSTRIRWNELGVRWDARREEAELLDTARGVALLPISLGPLSPYFLPPMYQVLASFGPCLVPDLTWTDLIEQRRGTDVRDEVHVHPRITLGALTVQRRTWRVPRACTPLANAAGGDSDVERFRATRAWARDLGLPRHVFVVPMTIQDFFRSRPTRGGIRRLHKPFYVDFEDPFAVQLLYRFVEETDAPITISEMLPAPEQALPFVDDEPRVSEFLLEWYADSLPGDAP